MRYAGIKVAFLETIPRLQWVVLAVAFIFFLTLFLSKIRAFPPVLWLVAGCGLVVVLLAIKSPSMLDQLIITVSTLRGKDTGGFGVYSWLGFSYITFRLLHTLFDRMAGRLSSVPLAEYVVYVIFFPSIVAGPIDKLDRFVRDLASPAQLDRSGWLEAGKRFSFGLFKKFVLADALAWIALNDVFASEIRSAGWLWILLYAYSLRIYLDFSGYTDVAIGLGRLLGIRLPENFASPYLKSNLTLFWNSWHMTLTQWFRAYFFNPLTRRLRSAEHPLPMSLMILLAQVGTMLLIGLWHGVSAGFVLWGVWHGIGLFVHNRWSDVMRTRLPSWVGTRSGQSILKASGIFLTFNYVSLGWLFFTLPAPDLAWMTLSKLFGFNL
jgi:D-alanyl-lipoteichoic acid acyltransferase DltB (MBOAT superfamily)